MEIEKRLENSGFTLIELLIVVAIIGILAAIAIPGYLGMQERSKKGALVRAASASDAELQAWLHSSHKALPGAALVETDSNGDGTIGAGDLPNSTLSASGVCSQYIVAHSGVSSPWGGKTIWTLDFSPSMKGQIACSIVGASISVVARDNTGTVIYSKIIFAE